MSTQTVTQSTSSQTYSIVLTRQDPRHTLIEEMIASGLYPEPQMREWNGDLIDLLVRWILPSGDASFAQRARALIDLPTERIDQLIAERENEILDEGIQEEIEERVNELMQTLAVVCVQDRIDIAQGFRQRLANQYASEQQVVDGLSNAVQEQDDARTERLTALDQQISGMRDQLLLQQNRGTALLSRRQNLQEERRALLQDAQARLQ
jgi:hypothetical protein